MAYILGGFPTLRKWAPLWVPTTMFVVVSTLAVNSRSIRGTLEEHFPGYIQMLRENYGFEDEDAQEREFYLAACEYQNRSQSVLVHSSDGRVEKIRIDGTMKAIDVSSLHDDMLSIDDDNDNDIDGDEVKGTTTGSAISCIVPIDEEISKREQSTPSNHYYKDEYVNKLDTIVQRSVWDNMIMIHNRQENVNMKEKKEEKTNKDSSIESKREHFIPSGTFTGSKEGYIFTTRDHRIGYYIDTFREEDVKKNQVSWNLQKTPAVDKMRQSCVKFFLDGLSVMSNEGSKESAQEIKDNRKLEKLQIKLDYHVREKNIGLRNLDDCEKDIKITKNEISSLKRKLDWGLW